MIVVDNHSIPSADEYLSLIDNHKIYIDKVELRKRIRRSRTQAKTAESLGRLRLKVESSGVYSSLHKDSLIPYLQGCGVNLERHRTKSGNISFSADKVVIPLIERGIQVGILEEFVKFNSIMRKISNMQSILDMHVPVVSFNNEANKCICEYPTTVTQRDNLRFYYSNIAVVNIPRDYSSIITVPSDDMFLVWVDFPQADWRFAYNLFIANDAMNEIMNTCDDSYEALARIVEGDDFNIDMFRANRALYKQYALEVFYNSHDSANVPNLIRNLFMSCPRYVKYHNDLKQLYQLKAPIKCSTYFGHTEILPLSYDVDRFISKGMNTPIQGFTSQIVMAVVKAVLTSFWELGFDSDDINAYMVRHDEPVFICKNTILRESWLFNDLNRIHIDGFSDIPLEFHFGTNYKVECKELTKAALSKQVPYKSPEIPRGTLKEYDPLPPFGSYYAEIFDTGTNYNLRLFDYRTGKRFSVEYSKDFDVSEILDNMVVRMVEKNKDLEFLIIKSTLKEGCTTIGNTSIKFIKEYDGSASS